MTTTDYIIDILRTNGYAADDDRIVLRQLYPAGADTVHVVYALIAKRCRKPYAVYSCTYEETHHCIYTESIRLEYRDEAVCKRIDARLARDAQAIVAAEMAQAAEAQAAEADPTTEAINAAIGSSQGSSQQHHRIAPAHTPAPTSTTAQNSPTGAKKERIYTMTKYITITAAGRTVDYTIDTCTAIDLLSIWTGRSEAGRQHALLVSYTGETGELIRNVVFGRQMPDDAADLLDMLADSTAWESDCDVLDTVRPSPRCIRVYTSGWRTGSGWDYQNVPLDDWDLGGSQDTMDKLPDEAADWMTSALLGDRPEDCDLVDAAYNRLVDVQITMELAEKVGDHEYITLDTRSAWQSDLAKAYIAKYGDSRTIAALAAKIRSLDTWDESLCAALCDAADMAAEWEAADGDTYESVVLAAAEKLGVEIL